MRKTSQSYSGHYNASIATAFAGLVLGSVFGDDADSRDERSTVPKATRDQAL